MSFNFTRLRAQMATLFFLITSIADYTIPNFIKCLKNIGLVFFSLVIAILIGTIYYREVLHCMFVF